MNKTVLAVLLGAAALCAQPNATPVRGAASFDPKALDRTTDPCVDFYQFACGGWLKANPIPADQSRWGRFNEMADRNRDILRTVLEDAAKPAASRSATEQKIGDYYASCMDEAAVNAKGLAPLEPVLARIRGLADKKGLAALLVKLHSQGMGGLFDFSSGQDFKDSSRVIAQLDQGGLGLPDRDYYLENDAKNTELRQKYLTHVERMFALAGYQPAAAKAAAAVVMKIETDLAQASLDKVSRRDPEKIYHLVSRKELAAANPNFDWEAYLAGSGAPRFESICVSWPDFFKALNSEIAGVSLEDWKTYLIWHAVHAEVPALPTAFIEENFDFYGRTLTGAKEMRPRWKRCADFTDAQLGEALGRAFVERAFGADSKQRTLKMVEALETALGQDIEKLDWMSAETRKQALVKLKAISNKIGYPEKWRDYSPVEIRRGDFLGNGMRADEFEFHRVLGKIGKPIDATEWDMTPPTVNAYYDPLMNNINFPAGILQRPFFDRGFDDAANFGGIGMVIGHELTHGFDDEGRQFDAKGNLRDWWTEADAKAFDQRTACLVDEYSKFEVAPGAKVNGKLTLGENTADLGGARVSLMALRNTIGSDQTAVEGFTPDQRFFLSLGQIWCENTREEAARLQVSTDPHSPAKFRVNGVVVNMTEFQKAFACKAGQPMVSANACRIW